MANLLTILASCKFIYTFVLSLINNLLTMSLLFGLVFIFSIAYFILEGHREAIFYSVMINNLVDDLHAAFMLQRMIVFLSIFSLTFYIQCWWSFLFMCSLLLCFPFFHDGAYYATRNNLNKNIYPKRWFDDSDTSTAKMEIKVLPRIFLAIVGIFIFIIFQLITDL